ncbi:MAG TPA: hypothetical protein VMF63_10570 [Opitutaceae bacterium]|nr:hypothetical protein [Opitutaceae bacterium]
MREDLAETEAEIRRLEALRWGGLRGELWDLFHGDPLAFQRGHAQRLRWLLKEYDDAKKRGDDPLDAVEKMLNDWEHQVQRALIEHVRIFGMAIMGMQLVPQLARALSRVLIRMGSWMPGSTPPIRPPVRPAVTPPEEIPSRGGQPDPDKTGYHPPPENKPSAFGNDPDADTKVGPPPDPDKTGYYPPPARGPQKPYVPPDFFPPKPQPEDRPALDPTDEDWDPATRNDGTPSSGPDYSNLPPEPGPPGPGWSPPVTPDPGPPAIDPTDDDWNPFTDPPEGYDWYQQDW